MKRFALTIPFALVLLLFINPAHGQRPGADLGRDRLAQTGMKFLSISVDPRMAALGDASTALTNSSASMFYNPAGMARINGLSHLSLNQVQWVGDFEYSAGSVALRPYEGQYGVVGISILMASYGEVTETIRTNNEEGYVDIGTFSPSALAFGVGYAQAITDQFSFGGHLKYARQSLGRSTMRLAESGDPVRSSNEEGTIVGDFGVLYNTGFRSLTFAFSVQNFSRELTYAQESFELPLTFNVGVAMDVMDFSSMDSDMHQFNVALDARRPRDYDEQIKLGGEYVFMDLLALRGGYVLPTDEQGVSLGAGLNLSISNVAFTANYAYTQFGRLGNVNRIGVAFFL